MFASFLPRYVLYVFVRKSHFEAGQGRSSIHSRTDAPAGAEDRPSCISHAGALDGRQTAWVSPRHRALVLAGIRWERRGGAGGVRRGAREQVGESRESLSVPLSNVGWAGAMLARPHSDFDERASG